MKKLAIFLPNWIGDVVMATPALRAVRDQFPSAEIVGIMRPYVADVLAGTGLMDRTLFYNPRGSNASQRGWSFVRNLQAERIDTALLLTNSIRTAWLAWLSGAKRRIGFARDLRGMLLTDRVAPKSRKTPHPALDEYLRLAEQLGCHSSSRRIELAVLPEDQTRLDEFWKTASLVPSPPSSGERDRVRGPNDRVGSNSSSRFIQGSLAHHSSIDLASPPHPNPLPPKTGGEGTGNPLTHNSQPSTFNLPYVCLNTGGAFGAAKNWPREHFVELARRVVNELGKTVLVVCGPSERDDARWIAAQANHPDVLSLADVPLSIGLTKAAIRGAELLVTTDSGPRHFAAAFGTPVITLFGPTHIAWSETNYDRSEHLQLQLDCGPCQQRECPLKHHRCMKELSVDSVFAAVQRQLAKHAAMQEAA